MDEEGLSEEELLEREIWEHKGDHYTIEELTDSQLYLAIRSIEESPSGWRIDWLPTLLVERERREEMKEEEEKLEPLQNFTLSQLSQLYQTQVAPRTSGQSLDYVPSTGIHVMRVTVDRMMEVLRTASLLPLDGKVPELPSDKFELHIMNEDVNSTRYQPASEATIVQLHEMIKQVGKLRMLRALFGEKPVRQEPKGLIDYKKLDPSMRATSTFAEEFAKALEKLDRYDGPSWQKTSTFLKHERNKYRK